jgi:hypothetical protein
VVYVSDVFFIFLTDFRNKLKKFQCCICERVLFEFIVSSAMHHCVRFSYIPVRNFRNKIFVHFSWFASIRGTLYLCLQFFPKTRSLEKQSGWVRFWPLHSGWINMGNFKSKVRNLRRSSSKPVCFLAHRSGDNICVNSEQEAIACAHHLVPEISGQR